MLGNEYVQSVALFSGIYTSNFSVFIVFFPRETLYAIMTHFRVTGRNYLEMTLL